jgi:hypothetical protein
LEVKARFGLTRIFSVSKHYSMFGLSSLRVIPMLNSKRGEYLGGESLFRLMSRSWVKTVSDYGFVLRSLKTLRTDRSDVDR